MDTIQLAMKMPTTAKPKFARLSFSPPMTPQKLITDQPETVGNIIVNPLLGGLHH